MVILRSSDEACAAAHTTHLLRRSGWKLALEAVREIPEAAFLANPEAKLETVVKLLKAAKSIPA